jgi:uncharacterized HAD superfamily protein
MEKEKEWLRIGIDIDGVLADTPNHLVKECKKRYGIEFKVEDIAQHAVEKVIPGLTEAMVIELFTDPDFYEDIPLIEGTKEALRYLRDSGDVIIYLVTSRPYNTIPVTMKWLEKNKLDWHLLKHTSDKATFCKNQNITMFIEDKLETVFELSKVCDYVILAGWPYNLINGRENKLPENVVRVEWY